ncbi:uncharacterized protein [Haliotis cracherodii]|uniref:uncharacterized protein n=1 Tax=Haliotis cracherodii TaxID=6455 RepID=UPI0039EBFB27
MKVCIVLFVSACMMVEAESGLAKDNSKCQEASAWCKGVNCDNPGMADTCPVTCGRCNPTDCPPGMYWNGTTCAQCLDGLHAENKGSCPCTITGKWGSKCEHQCNKGCLGGTCHPLSGECDNCTRDKYNKLCDNTCAANCNNCTDTSSNCHRTTGTCLCGCIQGFYGGPCERRCPDNCRFKTCNSSGICVHGCKEGYFGPKCHENCGGCEDQSCSRIGTCFKGCNSGWHGLKCNTRCSYNCEHSNCHRNGTCMTCLGGFHGDQCNKNCSAGCATRQCNRDSNVTCLNTSCSQTSGECDYGCVSGWYGATCSDTCPDNCSAGTCNRDGGSCLSCREGFRGTHCNMSCPQHCVECQQNASHCTSCEPGYFGNTCKKECDGCLDGRCNITDGVCIAGCKPSLYGRECQFNCSRNCLRQNEVSSCFQSNGTCVYGCNTGWYNAECDIPCPPGCSGTTCDDFTGRCSNGCTDALHGPHCNHTCSSNCKNSRCQMDSTNRTVLSCTVGCEDGMWGDYCASTCPGHCPKCNRTIGSCVKRENHKTPQTNTVVPWLVVLFVIIIILLIMALFVVRRNKHHNILKWRYTVGHSPSSSTVMSLINPSYQSTPRGSRTPEDSDYQELEPLTNTVREDDYITARDTDDAYTLTSNESCNDGGFTPDLGPPPCHVTDDSHPNTMLSTEVMVQGLRLYVEQMKRSGGFTMQCYNLPCGKLGPCDEAELPENVSKNRYRNILPYDHCRVKLSPISNIPGSDYINANYINGYGEQRTFVATQGPYGEVIRDFWRMLWEIDASKLIMLTNCVENRKAKCQKYWPDFGQPGSNYDDVHVQCVAEEELTDYTVRTFSIHREAELPRTLEQYHFTAWPDKGVPEDVRALVDFHRLVKNAPSTGKGPAVVHCSAGIGRTGTWIALDYLIGQAKTEGVVDVFDCIVRLRHQRMNVIQTEDQYIFLHEALMEALPSCDRRPSLVDNGHGDYEVLEKRRQPAKNPFLDQGVVNHHGNDVLPEDPLRTYDRLLLLQGRFN